MGLRARQFVTRFFDRGPDFAELWTKIGRSQIATNFFNRIHDIVELWTRLSKSQLATASLDRVLDFAGHWTKVGRSHNALLTILGLAAIFSVFLLHALFVPGSQTLFHLPGTARLRTEHPVEGLVLNAERDFNTTRKRQSGSLAEAVKEYKHRYGLAPPPHFDAWYDFATERNVRLIDEYDGIYHGLLPFWGLEPSVIRERTRKVLGREGSFLMGVSIRNSHVRAIGRGQGDFQFNGTIKMIEKYARWLPDMDLAFNVHDEPRVLVPHEDLEVLLKIARKNIASVRPTSNFSSISPSDLGSGGSYRPAVDTYFADLTHQLSWTHTRLSCPPTSPARSLVPNTPDDIIAYSTDSLGFITNTTAFSDICLSPSLSSTFNRFNSYDFSLDLLPIFTPSKLSSFQDILYPSTYYYTEKVHYDNEVSVPWDEKDPRLYWRGSTSSGWAEQGSWPHLLRQSVVMHLTAKKPFQTLQKQNASAPSPNTWMPYDLPASAFESTFDVQFTEIKNCAPADCEEQEAFFNVTEKDPQSEAWKARYLLDMDGNAFSGRFYAFLRSHSLPFKLAYFREWHAERLQPWVHYVPVSREAREVPELVRYFEQEPEGGEIARSLARNGHEWAEQALRKEDMEVYMFRLLLEYGRLVDDDRQNLGYA